MADFPVEVKAIVPPAESVRITDGTTFRSAEGSVGVGATATVIASPGGANTITIHFIKQRSATAGTSKIFARRQGTGEEMRLTGNTAAGETSETHVPVRLPISTEVKLTNDATATCSYLIGYTINAP